MVPFSLNLHGSLHEYSSPLVMGILNATPDSFFAPSRALAMDLLRRRVELIVGEGADMIDVGAFSTRPGADDVSEDEELRRLDAAIAEVRRCVPGIPVSVDTFRSAVAIKAVTEMGADIINDVSGGNADPDMFAAVASLHVPYILTHSRGSSPGEMQHVPDYSDFIAEVLSDLADKVSDLKFRGVNDIIIDPGFGFSKSLDLNYSLLSSLEALGVFRLPVLVGLSRKSMFTRLLDISPDEALNATTVGNTIALLRGASILRVHDVKAARQAVTIFNRSLPSFSQMPC